MSTGSLVTLIALIGLIAGAIWLFRRERADRRRADEERKHAPAPGQTGYDRGEHIRKGGTWPGGTR